MLFYNHFINQHYNIITIYILYIIIYLYIYNYIYIIYYNIFYISIYILYSRRKYVYEWNREGKKVILDYKIK